MIFFFIDLPDQIQLLGQFQHNCQSGSQVQCQDDFSRVSVFFIQRTSPITPNFSDPKANPNKMTLDLNSLLDTNETKWVTDFTGKLFQNIPYLTLKNLTNTLLSSICPTLKRPKYYHKERLHHGNQSACLKNK